MLTTEYATWVVPDVLTDGRSCYVASHPDLPGCVGYDDTPDGARAALAQARAAYLAHLRSEGAVIPVPTGTLPDVEWITA